MSDQTSGFDSLEYPLDYVFKAMCRADAQQSSQAHVVAWLTPVLQSSDLRKMSVNASRTGKFESVSFTVRLNSRAELDAIYQRLYASPRVVMTL